MKHQILIIAFLFALSVNNFAQNYNPEITTDELKVSIGFLASDSLKGRKPGTPEINVAADFIKSYFVNAGLKPICDDGFQDFELVTKVTLGKKNSFYFMGIKGEVKKDFTPLAFSKTALLNTKAVFAGYGLSVKTDSINWDDYKGVDVKGKWVLLLRGHPELSKSESKFNEYADERTKVLNAEDKGASGVIFITPVEIDKADELMHLSYDQSPSQANIPVINITRKLADSILSISKKPSAEELESTINKTKKSINFIIYEKLLVEADIILQKENTKNVVAMIEGSDPVLKNEYIVIGAHYDHLGMGGAGSGSRMPDTVAIHNGADDNASGVAGVIELAQKLSSEKAKLKRSVIFVTFSAEEMGLLGSKYMAKHLPVKTEQIKAMINLDMIGRLSKTEPALTISGTGTSVETDSILKELITKTNIPLKYSPEGYGPSDQASFYAENIPVFFLTTGAHEDYHTPFDDAYKINYDGEKQVLDYTYLLSLKLINIPKALTFKEAGPKSNGGYGGTLKVTLGIMPDMASQDNNGLKADLVRKGGPAEKAGMLKGDIIVAVDGKPVKNIYEYMARLKQLQKGQLVSVDVMRNGQKVVLLVQL